MGVFEKLKESAMTMKQLREWVAEADDVPGDVPVIAGSQTGRLQPRPLGGAMYVDYDSTVGPYVRLMAVDKGDS